jgi:three-Cys-motif partner protein
MNKTDFFDESREQSQTKARIVSKYFPSWANVIKNRARHGKLAYIELFAGTGRYQDGTASTPLMVLKEAISRGDLRNMVVSLFVEKDSSYCDCLRREIGSLSDVECLKYSPLVIREQIDHRLATTFQEMRLVPSLVFADPCGYKGLSLDLISSVIKDWACECVFFFNYNRINAGLMNPLVDQHMNDIFGEDRADCLRRDLPGMNPDQKEKCILSALTLALNETHGRYVLPFRFEKEDGSRTSHYIVHVTKHPRGYEIMKEIMAKESTTSPQGVPSFEYAPAKARQPLLFETCCPLDDLKKSLLREYAGQKKLMKVIFGEHNIGTPYIKKNYKDALLQLEKEGLLKAERKVNRPDTLGDEVPVQFANKE